MAVTSDGTHVVTGPDDYMARIWDLNTGAEFKVLKGHTDSVGSDSMNMKLSQARADSVKAALVREGVDPSRMDSVGYGPTRPIESNKTRAGRALNRRTEFNIIEQ